MASPRTISRTSTRFRCARRTLRSWRAPTFTPAAEPIAARWRPMVNPPIRSERNAFGPITLRRDENMKRLLLVLIPALLIFAGLHAFAQDSQTTLTTKNDAKLGTIFAD